MPLVTEPQALELLKQGEVVALPTETVYGLAGRVDQDSALKKIFATKNRPFFDPLIVHVKDFAQAQEWGDLDIVSATLAKAFWPGPLTLVVPKKNHLSPLINNGGPTVALRSPNHPLFLNLLEKLGVPLAAPSANMFGKTSPTEAEHVLEEFQNQVAVLDGGLCFKGIESTVVQADPTENKIFILRPGIIHQEELSDFCQEHKLNWTVQTKKSDVAPGHLQNHYQPSVPLVLIDTDQKLGEEAQDLLKKIDERHWQELTVDPDVSLAARQLYANFRNLSKKQQPAWMVVKNTWKSDPRWAGFYDRIQKAASGTLTLEKGKWRVFTKT